MRTVGLVCEGVTDHPVIEAVLEAIFGDFEPRYLQPEFDRLEPATSSGGWTRVQDWCCHWAENLAYLPNPPDLIVVHVDADVRTLVGVSTTEELCAKIRGWLGPSAKRHGLVIVLPKECTETWLLASHTPATPSLEALEDVASRLAGRGLLKLGEHGRPVKDRGIYANLSVPLTAKLPQLRKVLRELDRFACKLETLA